jgi:hypothetical protein
VTSNHPVTTISNDDLECTKCKLFITNFSQVPFAKKRVLSARIRRDLNWRPREVGTPLERAVLTAPEYNYKPVTVASIYFPDVLLFLAIAVAVVRESDSKSAHFKPEAWVRSSEHIFSSRSVPATAHVSNHQDIHSLTKAVTVDLVDLTKFFFLFFSSSSSVPAKQKQFPDSEHAKQMR